MKTVNAKDDLQQRMESGKVAWSGPLILLMTRSFLAIICQVLVYFVFFSGKTNGWNASGEWWRVYGTVIDLGCIFLLFWFARHEGIKLFDLGRYRRNGLGRDILIGLGLSIPLLFAFVIPTVVLEIL